MNYWALAALEGIEIMKNDKQQKNVESKHTKHAIQQNKSGFKKLNDL